jgi:ABC-2 type transport system permease protein
MTEVHAIMAISYRDLMKLLRDPVRLVASLIFPVIFIGIMGGTFESNIGGDLGYNYLTFLFTGIFAQTLFQSAAIGIVSLIEDRENDFSQEIFVSPVSRYSIVFGKIMGETYVAMVQGIAIVIFGLIIGVEITGLQFATLIVFAIFVCIYGGAFGVIIMANLGTQRAANQIFPFIMLPQYFLAGVFTPIQNLPWFLEILSRISPMRYAVDLVRGVFYYGKPGYDAVVLTSPIVNAIIMTVSFLAFLAIGTAMFVRSERNR